MKPKVLVLAVVVLIIGFLTYRYFVFGKGNKGLINPTLFGF